VNYRRIVEILTDADFTEISCNGSHRKYEGWVNGQRMIVTVAYHRINDDVLPKTLASMIRQSGLPKKLFR
jgi:predicted RNA binding protein YcfA (HicA-like mRNA interferase family)